MVTEVWENTDESFEVSCKSGKSLPNRSLRLPNYQLLAQ